MLLILSSLNIGFSGTIKAYLIVSVSYPFLSLNLNGCLLGIGVVYFEITDV